MDFQSLQMRKLTNVSPAPAQGGMSTVRIPIGPTYYGFALRYKVNGVDCSEAQAKTDIRLVRVKVNDQVRLEYTGKHLVEIANKYYGLGFTAGQVFIPLARPWYKTPEAVENTAWGTANVDNLTIEIDWNTPIVNPTLDIHSFYSIYSRDLGTIIETREVSYNAGTIGQQEITTLPKTNGDIVALHLESANITTCDIEINTQLYTQGQDLSIMQNFTKWFALRSPQTGYIHFDAHLRDLLSDAIPVVNSNDFRLKPVVSATGLIPILVETLNAPLGASRARAA